MKYILIFVLALALSIEAGHPHQSPNPKKPTDPKTPPAPIEEPLLRSAKAEDAKEATLTVVAPQKTESTQEESDKVKPPVLPKPPPLIAIAPGSAHPNPIHVPSVPAPITPGQALPQFPSTFPQLVINPPMGGQSTAHNWVNVGEDGETQLVHSVPAPMSQMGFSQYMQAPFMFPFFQQQQPQTPAVQADGDKPQSKEGNEGQQEKLIVPLIFPLAGINIGSSLNTQTFPNLLNSVLPTCRDKCLREGKIGGSLDMPCLSLTCRCPVPFGTNMIPATQAQGRCNNQLCQNFCRAPARIINNNRVPITGSQGYQNGGLCFPVRVGNNFVDRCECFCMQGDQNLPRN